MRIHLLGLPNAPTTPAFYLDGFSQMNWRFARMLKSLGHTVIHYGAEGSTAECDEFVQMISDEERTMMLNGIPYQNAAFGHGRPLWALANPRTQREIGKRKQRGDMICLIGGASQQPVCAAHHDLFVVEYSIGYVPSFAPYRVFESHVWRHWTYAANNWEHGRFFDAVIPCFYEPADFVLAPKEDFLLFVGRFTAPKGVEIACEIAKRAGLPLYLIGYGDRSLISYGEVLGVLPTAERNAWMARARAVLCPSAFIEPFNQVACEAQMAGTPVVATGFGGFVETVISGVTGYLATYMPEFVQGVRDAEKLDPLAIRRSAEARFSVEVVTRQYQRYFDQLASLWGDGFYAQ